VKNHGGEIKVWSQVGVGTVFYVYLPRPTAGASAPPVPHVPPPTPPPTSRPL
jgi:hypothetical protein